MTLLQDISSFPEGTRRILEGDYGIETAESFFVHALKDPKGVRSALSLTPQTLDKLVKLVEGHLDPDYIELCHHQPVKSPRGVILD